MDSSRWTFDPIHPERENLMGNHLMIIDPNYPERGVRPFEYDEKLDRFVDSENQSRIVKFVAVLGRSWHRTGNAHIGKNVLLLSYDEKGHILEKLLYKVQGWLPKNESDFVDSFGNPAPLWRAVDEGDDVVDLEESELLDGRAAFYLQDGLEIYKHLEGVDVVKGRLFWSSVENYDRVVVTWAGEQPMILNVQTLFAVKTRVSAVDLLWTDQLLDHFFRIKFPYKYCDCIPEFTLASGVCSHGSASSMIPKSKRGRPRKRPHPLCEGRYIAGRKATAALCSATEHTGLPQKRKRGRPRKLESSEIEGRSTLEQSSTESNCISLSSNEPHLVKSIQVSGGPFRMEETANQSAVKIEVHQGPTVESVPSAVPGVSVPCWQRASQGSIGAAYRPAGRPGPPADELVSDAFLLVYAGPSVPVPAAVAWKVEAAAGRRGARLPASAVCWTGHD
jgi:hypothetical protein